VLWIEGNTLLASMARIEKNSPIMRYNFERNKRLSESMELWINNSGNILRRRVVKKE
jgi:hypothetical protein